MTIIAVPKILRDKLTDEGADALVQIIDKVEEQSQAGMMQMAEERFEKRVAQLEGKLEVRFGQMDARFAQLETKIAQSQAEIIRWTFAFVMGQFWAIVGTLFVFFRK